MFGITLNPLDWVTDAAGAAVGVAGDVLFDSITGWIEDGLSYVATEVGTRLAEMSEADFGSQAADQLSGSFKWLALAVLVGSIMVAAVSAALAPSGGVGDVLREVPVSLVLLAGWFAVWTLWFELMSAITGAFVSASLLESMENGLVMDPSIMSFARATVALLMIVFLIVFLIELVVLQYVLAIGVIISQVTVGLRPIRGLRQVSGEAIRNLVSLSLVPPLATASLSFSLGTVNESGIDFVQMLVGMAGLLVSILMPMVVARFIPLGGNGQSPARGLLGFGAAAAGVAVTGGAALAGGAVGAAASGAGGGGAAGGQLAQAAAGAPPGGPPGAPPTGASAAAIPGPSPSAGASTGAAGQDGQAGSSAPAAGSSSGGPSAAGDVSPSGPMPSGQGSGAVRPRPAAVQPGSVQPVSSEIGDGAASRPESRADAVRAASQLSVAATELGDER